MFPLPAMANKRLRESSSAVYGQNNPARKTPLLARTAADEVNDKPHYRCRNGTDAQGEKKIPSFALLRVRILSPGVCFCGPFHVYNTVTPALRPPVRCPTLAECSQTGKSFCATRREQTEGRMRPRGSARQGKRSGRTEGVQTSQYVLPYP